MGPIYYSFLAFLCAMSRADAAPVPLVHEGQPQAEIVLPADADAYLQQAAEEILTYVERISGARLPQTHRLPDGPAVVLGPPALELAPDLRDALQEVSSVQRLNPVDEGFAIVVRDGRVLLAGNSTLAVRHAAYAFLEALGVRWYFPGEIGEVVPSRSTLQVSEDLYVIEAPDFPIRRIWYSWVMRAEAREKAQERYRWNERMRASEADISAGHALDRYLAEQDRKHGLSDEAFALQEGRRRRYLPSYTSEEALEAVVREVREELRKNAGRTSVSLSIPDGTVYDETPETVALDLGIRDKYFLKPMVTGAVVHFNNRVAERIAPEYPDVLFGFLVYTYATLPPLTIRRVHPNLVPVLAPIDLDPVHPLGESPPTRELEAIIEGWTRLSDHLLLYDYDQGMLVWRGLPESHLYKLRQDIPRLHRMGVKGFTTEARMTTFVTGLNHYLRYRLYWDVEADVDDLLDEFYRLYYGPAARSMRGYWETLDRAWAKSGVTEHEYQVIPAVFTPDVLSDLQRHQEKAERKAEESDAEEVLRRLDWTRRNLDHLLLYVEMYRAAATDADYIRAAQLGAQLREMEQALWNWDPSMFRLYGEEAPWSGGEVIQYREMAARIDGSRGKLLARLPLEWRFRRDPRDTGVVQRWFDADHPIEDWQLLRTDLYWEAQGIRDEEGWGYDGFAWYAVDLQLDEIPPEEVSLTFPGLLGAGWIFVNGVGVHHQPFPDLWWFSDYRFTSEAPIGQYLRRGRNRIVLRVENVIHFGGLFRRPFLWRVSAEE